MISLSSLLIVATLTPTPLPAQITQVAQDMAREAAPTPTLTPSKDTRSHAITRGVLLAVAAGLDIHSTRQSIQAGNVERHSWLYGRRPTVARMITVKTVVGGALWLTSREAAKRHGRVEGMMPVAIYSAKQIVAAILNYRLAPRSAVVK